MRVNLNIGEKINYIYKHRTYDKYENSLARGVRIVLTQADRECWENIFLAPSRRCGPK